MSQSGLTDPAREGDWDGWYVEHLRVMSAVNGVDSAQRFKTTTHGFAPSLAMYSVRSADVFQDPYYQSIRGLGDFQPLIDRRHYHRNLFAGLEFAPAVAHDQALLVCDATSPCVTPGIEFVWLESVGIDRSTPFRGIAVTSATPLSGLSDRADIARYVPATGVYQKRENR